MKIINRILSMPGRYDNRISEFKPSDFGRYILTWLGPPKEHMIGKIIQVRLEAGDFGSDMVLLRHFDNSLRRHENQSFYAIPESFTKELDDLFLNIDTDSIETEYTIADGEQPETGFIIPSKIPKGESTPMRDITKAIHYQIEKIIEINSNEHNQI